LLTGGRRAGVSMVDGLTPERRSRLMSRVRSKDTTPELVVRRILVAFGIRYRLHRVGLPGRPDIVVPSRRTAIFVHGCFWHRHTKCRKASNPTTRADFWNEKFRRNVERDAKNVELLQKEKWRVLIVWECQTKDQDRLRATLRRLLNMRSTTRRGRKRALGTRLPIPVPQDRNLR
jgi:DNA mismatch endonuclease, patch repair protein